MATCSGTVQWIRPATYGNPPSKIPDPMDPSCNAGDDKFPICIVLRFINLLDLVGTLKHVNLQGQMRAHSDSTVFEAAR